MTCLIILSNITNIWLLAEETELQRVPENFESVEEYVRVLEPLLFEECRAQLYSTYEELQETITRDAYIMVRVKNVERRERAVALPLRHCGAAAAQSLRCFPTAKSADSRASGRNRRRWRQREKAYGRVGSLGQT
ncbi:hypothetical protein B296_00006536 [Ensete ventricosum]|uniref:Uncharacterized protein n=1 Tax=Ensete ventricosum TaxID=4639 RepID=A0A427AA41_ENSVE|nr:hypothetical protein B296_00006536 [Ensete ventricosum]